MKVLSFGSLNFDYVYEMEHFVQPKETTSSLGFHRNFGGKGLNQSIALAKAGVDVYHAGMVGHDGQPFIDYLNSYEVKTDYLFKNEAVSTGHAIIQLSHGENCIILHGGANQAIEKSHVDEILSHFEQGDFLLIQNEISSLAYLIQQAHELGMKIAFNVAPMNDRVFEYPLDLVDYFIVNEVEAKGLSKYPNEDIDGILEALAKSFPESKVVVTVGKEGSYFLDSGNWIHQPAFPVEAIDTTAAGDTFTGFFLATILQGGEVSKALRMASIASSLAVTKEGAAQSIPSYDCVYEKGTSEN